MLLGLKMITTGHNLLFQTLNKSLFIDVLGWKLLHATLCYQMEQVPSQI